MTNDRARMLDADEAAEVKERVAELTGGTKQPGQRERVDTTAPCYSRDWLYEQYHGQGLSLRELAKKCNVGPDKIRNRLVNLGIEIRSRGRLPED